MTWTQTHRRWQALQEIEALANAGCADLPWNAEYADIFGDRDTLAAVLRYRVRLSQDTQLDSHLPEALLDEQRRRLEERQAGVLRMVRRWESGTVTGAGTYAEVVRTTAHPGPVTAA